MLLILTLVAQFALISYHDEFVFRLRALEGELLEDMAAVNSVATDAVNAAYEYNDWTTGAAGEGSDGIMTTAKFGNYSMEPMDILRRAGVDHSAGYVPSVTVREARLAKKSGEESKRIEAELPPLEDIQSMYGNRSFILGLERCEEFRRTVHPVDRLMGPAGMFNSATNLLNKLLRLNCVNESRKRARRSKQATGMMLQAPWGKHNPVAWRMHHEAAVGGKGVRQSDFLPIVMTKDPVTWMASMCRHSYEARWRHTREHCPNLVPNEVDREFRRQPGKGTMGIKVKFATQHIGDEPIPDKKNKTFVEYTSLLDLWNTWYRQWRDASFPRLMVRFEDLLFHAEDTVAQICACGGGTMRGNFKYVEDSAKGEGGPHAGSAGFLASLVTYGNRTLRMEGILEDRNDLDYARQHLDKELMELFGYAPI